MKNTTNFEGMTLAETKTKLIDLVNRYNKSEDGTERAGIRIECDKFAEQYNTLSMLSLYAQAMADEIPLIYLIKAHHYGICSVKFEQSVSLSDDKKIVVSMSGNVSFDSKRKADMFDFIDWAEKSNKKVTTKGDWKLLTAIEREKINDEFRKGMNSDTEYKISKRVAHDVLQNCFDALIFVPSATGKNAIFPNKDCKNLIVSCAAEYKEKIKDNNSVDCSLSFFARKRWQNTIQNCLYLVLSEKTITYSYGDPEDAKPNSEEAPVEKTSTKKTSPKKTSAKKSETK